MVIIDILLDLGLPLSHCWLIDGHLDIFMVISDDDRSQGGVLGMHDLVINGPESVEVQSVLVVLHCGFHLQVGLVTNNMVNFFEPNGSQDLVEFLGQVMRIVARQERPIVFRPFNKGMNRVSVGLDDRKDDSSILVRQLVRSSDRYAAIGNGMLVYSSRVLHSQGDVFDSISMFNQMFVHLLR